MRKDVARELRETFPDLPLFTIDGETAALLSGNLATDAEARKLAAAAINADRCGVAVIVIERGG